MFSQAYIMFSIGMIKPFQKSMYPKCFGSSEDCPEGLVKVQNYIQLVGIILGTYPMQVYARSPGLQSCLIYIIYVSYSLHKGLSVPNLSACPVGSCLLDSGT